MLVWLSFVCLGFLLLVGCYYCSISYVNFQESYDLRQIFTFGKNVMWPCVINTRSMYVAIKEYQSHKKP